MAHKTLFRPTFILTLHKMPIPVSYRSFRPSQQPFSFLNTHRIPLPATARTTSNTHTHLWCSNFSTNTAIEGSEKCYLYLTDEDLMRQCEMDTFKASGPGGQHRNKRESAVRLKHLPTGIIAQASEDRSQHKNRASALNRLRSLIALKVEGSVSEAAKYLGLSTGALSRLILSDESLRKEVNDLRASKGMKPLK